MIEIVYGLLPFMFLFLGSIMALSGNPNDGGKQSSSINYSLPFTNQILALVINTILIINKHDFIQKNGLYITANSLWIIEIIIIASLLISFSMKHSLIDSHSQPMAFSIFMLFISSIVGIFLTENLLVIAIFYLLSIISLGIFILFGDFKKKKQSMAKFTQVSVISSIILIITLLITEITFGTFSLTELGLKFNDASFTTRLIIFLGLFFGFGTLPGIFSFNLVLIRRLFKIINIPCLKVMGCIFFPVSALIIIKITQISYFSELFYTYFLYGFGFLGFVWSSTQMLLEVFGKRHKQQKLIQLIFGYLSTVEFNLMLIIGSCKRLVVDYDNEVLINKTIFQFFLLSVFAKIILLTILTPIMHENKEWDLTELGGYSNKLNYSKLFPLSFSYPILYFIPFLIGNDMMYNILNAISVTNYTKLAQTTEMWGMFIMLILYFIFCIIIGASIINEIFFGNFNSRNLKNEKKEVVSFSKDYFWLIGIGIISLILISLFLQHMDEINFYNYLASL